MLRAKWGRLIFISSTAANVGGVVGPHYAASKAGMIGLMHSYASNLVKAGITANMISPALVETDMVRSDLRITPDRIPVGRIGRVEEVVEAAVMLARIGYIAGQAINLNGGARGLHFLVIKLDSSFDPEVTAIPRAACSLILL